MNRLCLIALILAGCHSDMSPQKSPSSLPAASAPGMQHFENSNAGVAFLYPVAWKTGPATKTHFEFDLGHARLDFDYPDLPTFTFGLPLGMIESNYNSNIQKTITDAKVTDLPAPAIADAKCRRVNLTGHVNGSPAINEAVLIVHASRVYVLSIDCDDKSYPAAKAALDEVVTSLRWMR